MRDLFLVLVFAGFFGWWGYNLGRLTAFEDAAELLLKRPDLTRSGLYQALRRWRFNRELEVK